MKKIILLFIILSLSVSAAPWLTNGINPGSISFFGDFTGDGNSDVTRYGYDCYINIQNNSNPKFQNYQDLKCYFTNGYGVFRPSRKKNGYFYDGWQKWPWPFYGGWMCTQIGDCIFTAIYHTVYSSVGNDIDGNGQDDLVFYSGRSY